MSEVQTIVYTWKLKGMEYEEEIGRWSKFYVGFMTTVPP
jgi:hypothetical protein